MNWKRIAFIIVMFGIGIFLFFKNDINNILLLKRYSDIFLPEDIEENFRNIQNKYPSITIKRKRPAYKIPEAIRNSALPESFQFGGEELLIREEIEKRHLTSLLVIKGGKIIHEEYPRGNTKDSQVIVFSCSKSIASILIGIAYESGNIKSLEDPAGKYVSDLKGTVYENVTIQNLLDMSSGVKWDEIYDDLSSDIVLTVIASLTGSLNAYAQDMTRKRPQGTFNQYTSFDTQVLAMIIEGATGRSYTDYLNEKLWSKLGVENDAYFLTDKIGFPIAYGGLMVTARDMAKIGLLMNNNGMTSLGEQLFSEDWIQASITPDAPRLMPGRGNELSDWAQGYKNQW